MTPQLHAGNKRASMLDMHQVDRAVFQTLDFKTLLLLAKLLETASVTRTAEAMGMSQPAASRAVDRLRKATGDPLLVRTRKGYALTTRAEELRPLVEQALSGIAHVFDRGTFDPGSTRRQFRLATTDYGAVAAVTPLMARLARVAPMAVLDVTTWSDDTLERLETGKCDLALYADSELPPDFHYRELYRETYAVVMRKSHPVMAARSSGWPNLKSLLDHLSAYPRAVMMFPDGRQLAADDVLGRLGLVASRTVFRAPYFMSAPWIIAETDIILCVPMRVAHRMTAISGVGSIPLPASVETFSYRMIWHERAHRDQGHAWFRALLLEACRSASPASP